ncbi:MAG: hypothetical protein JWO14_2845 [Solirubrobacterales bacterium]|nr:hypothetical protein [Solirubrobacterales bacterium]
MGRGGQWWRSLREASGRFAIGVAAALVGLAIIATGASAATLTVNTLADNPATSTSTECSGVASDCSLRQALDKAAAGDTITFDVTGTITLNQANGPLLVHTTVTINGPGASRLAIDGGGSTRILNVYGPSGPSSGPSQLSISGLTLQNGMATEGGAIYVSGSGGVAVDSAAFADDTAQGGGSYGLGGAIATGASSTEDRGFASVSVKDSSFTGNSATGATYADGGAIYVDGRLSIEGSTFAGNTATYTGGCCGDPEGGAVYLLDLPGSISNSTFTGNSTAGGYGGGGALYVPYTTLTDDTIDGNTATGIGGGIAGEGVVAYGTILSGNIGFTNGGNGQPNDCSQVLANGASTTSYLLAGGSCIGRPLSVDPMLGALTDNGGPTQTQAITPSSPAYGAVPADVCDAAPFLRVDQRGLPRPGTGEANCDIGAYEYQASPTSISLASSEDPSPTGGQVSFTATVSPTPDGGTVAFTDGGTPISGCGTVPVSASGQAICGVTYAAAGSHSIAAGYSGDASFASSTSPTLDQVVQPAPATESGGGGGTGGGGTNSGGGGSPSQTRTLTARIGNQQITLVTSPTSTCVARSGPLDATLISSAIPGSKAARLRFTKAAFSFDRGVPNHTVGRLPTDVSLSLAGLNRGSHTLRVKLSYLDSVTRRGHHHTVTVSKTLSLTFNVC